MSKASFAFALLALSAAAAVPLHSRAQAELSVRDDDFSNEQITTLTILSGEARPSVLHISCFPESGLQIQLSFNGTIFPDSASGGRMMVNITHKFDAAESAHTTGWGMNFMKYKDAWYQGDVAQFFEEALRANRLSLRLNRRGDVVRFGLSGAGSHLNAVRDACAPDPAQ